MRTKFTDIVEKSRAEHPLHMSTKSGDKFGYFDIKFNGNRFSVIISDGGGWDHVSVTLNRKRCPTWEEMCWIKDQFFDENETVVQYHPAKSDYVNNHRYCLHLWKPTGAKLPTPESLMIGIK